MYDVTSNTSADNTQVMLRKDQQKQLFERFVTFIDASPNTVRTYRASLRQWFKYLADNDVSNPTPGHSTGIPEALKRHGEETYDHPELHHCG